MTQMDPKQKCAWLIAVVGALGVGMASTAGCGPGDAPGHIDRDGGGGGQQDTGVDTGDQQMDTGPEQDTAGPAVVETSKKQITFEGINKGASKSVEVRIRNVGDEPTWVEDVLVDEVGEERGPDTEEFELGGKADSTPFRLATSVHETVTVTYKPTDFATDRGRLTVKLRHDQPDIEVPIETINAHSDLQMPKSLRIGQVDKGETGDLLVTVKNQGIKPLTLKDMILEEDQDFTIKYRSSDGRTTDKPFPVSLERREPFQFYVEYTAPDTDTAVTQLTVKSNDPDEPEYTASVSANRPEPCLELETSELDFGQVSSNTTTKTLKMLNCNRATGVEVESAMFTSSGGGVFSLIDQPEFPVTLAPGQTEELTVQAKFEEPRSAVGSLIIRAPGAERSPFLVEVRAERR